MSSNPLSSHLLVKFGELRPALLEKPLAASVVLATFSSRFIASPEPAVAPHLLSILEETLVDFLLLGSSTKVSASEAILPTPDLVPALNLFDMLADLFAVKKPAKTLVKVLRELHATATAKDGVSRGPADEQGRRSHNEQSEEKEQFVKRLQLSEEKY